LINCEYAVDHQGIRNSHVGDFTLVSTLRLLVIRDKIKGLTIHALKPGENL